MRTEHPPSYQSELVNNLYFVTPEQCVENISSFPVDHCIGYLGASFSFGTMEHSKVVESMKLFADKVIP